VCVFCRYFDEVSEKIYDYIYIDLYIFIYLFIYACICCLVLGGRALTYLYIELFALIVCVETIVIDFKIDDFNLFSSFFCVFYLVFSWRVFQHCTSNLYLLNITFFCFSTAFLFSLFCYCTFS